jgi:hypothetical protein
MKKLLCILLIGIFITSCSVSKNSYKSKPTAREIRNGMKYSDWRYYYPTKMYQSNYIYYDNKVQNTRKENNQ